jgi:hypothetical protein
MSIKEWIAEFNPEALMADGFDKAIIGMAVRCGMSALVVYDAVKCIDILVKRDSMTPEEAAEFFSFNTLGAYVGENTPLFLWRPPR